MTRHQPPLFFNHRYRLDIRQVFVASLIAGVLSPAIVGAADKDKNPAQTRFREVAPWLPRELLPAGKLIAFEEHPHFVYLAGRPSASQEPSRGDDRKESHIRLVFLRPATLVVDVWPFETRHRDIGKPTATSTVEVPLASGKKSRRAVCVYHSPVQKTARRTESIRIKDDVCDVAITSYISWQVD